jgi:hypothetical protein
MNGMPGSTRLSGRERGASTIIRCSRQLVIPTRFLEAAGAMAKAAKEWGCLLDVISEFLGRLVV